MRYFIFVSMLLLSLNDLIAQCFCTEEQCEEGLNANFGSQGGPTFCDGEEITLLNTSEPGFDYFVVDWSDGVVDTIFNYSNPSHVYTISEDELCDDPAAITVCVIGYQVCDAGISCHFSSTGFAIKPRPLAEFEVDSEVCRASPVSFTDQSCNAVGYLWEFGDGQTSTIPNPDHLYGAPGDYSVTLTVTNGCGTNSVSHDVTVVEPPAAMITATADPATGCEPVTLDLASQSNQYTNLQWNISPFNNLLYCALDPGDWCLPDILAMLTDAELEVLFNVPGIYTITLTGSNVCGDVTDTYTLEVLETPEISLMAPDVECDAATFTAADFNLQFDGAIDAFNWTFTGGTPATATGADFGTVTFATSGTVTLEIVSDCGNISETIDITIANTEPITLGNNPSTLCQNDDPIQLMVSPTGGNWVELPGGTLDPAAFAPGIYNFTYEIGADDCPNSTTLTIEILETPEISLTAPEVECDAATFTAADFDLQFDGAIDAFNWTFTGGTPATATGANFGTVSFSTSGTVSLEIESDCGNLSETIDITIANTEPITLGNNPSTLCQNDDPIQLMVSPSGGDWVELPGDTLDPAAFTPGTYTFTYQIGANDCPNSTMLTIEILEGVDVSLDTEAPGCETLSFIPDVQYEGQIDSYDWVFTNGTPATSNQENPGTISFNTPGLHPVMVTVSGACGVESDTIEVEVQENVNLSIDPVDAPLCAGSSPYQLIVNNTGGTWSGNGITDAENGVFDPSTVMPDNTYTVTYTLENGACSASAMIEIEVVSSATVIVNNETLCVDSNPLMLTASVTGGQWMGTGIVDEMLGTFDPVISGEGTFFPTYTFTDTNGCEVTASPTVTVEPYPVLSLLDTIELCLTTDDIDLSEAFAYNATPDQGVSLWAGDGVTNGNLGVFNSSTTGMGAGLYSLTVTYTLNDCTQTQPAWINIIESPELELSPDQAVCITDQQLQLEANLGGGTWDGEGINEQGLIDLELIGDGIFTYDYIYEEGSSCEQSGSTTVEIIDLSQIIQVGGPVELCEGEVSTYTFTGQAPIDGTWEGSALLNSNTGEVDVTQLVLDSLYIYTYCIESESVSACSACANTSLIVYANPVAAFSFMGTPCIGQTFTMIDESENADEYSWAFGDLTTSMLTNPTHVYTEQATYTLSLEVTSLQGCTDAISQELYITTPPTVAFDLSEDEGCAAFLIEVENNSFGDEITQYWLVAGDTIFSPELEDVFLDSITTDSVFAIELVVSNLCGEVRQVDSVLVHPYPRVNFGMNIDEGCSPLEISFANTTLGNAQDYFWDLGNGETSTDSIPPVQEYTTTDTTVTVYDVLLIATNECGVDSLIKQITVYSPDVTAFIGLDTLGGCQPFTVQLESFSTPGSNISWEITDTLGNTYSSNLPNPIFTFLESGLHTIILGASQCGTDFDTSYLEVLPAPEVSFTHRPYICVGQIIDFQNGSVGISSNEWDFGDGQFSTSDNPSHQYDSAGIFTVSLTAYSDFNDCPAVFTSEVLVVDNPIAAFSPSVLSGCSPLTIDFANQSSGLGVLNYNWQFSDGSSFSFEQNPTHTFFEPGNYPVQLIVSDQDSCFADTAIFNIFVFPDPISIFEFPSQPYCHRYDTVSLMNQSVNGVAFTWQLPDTSFTSVNGQWLPSFPGLQNMVLIAESSNGCRDTSSQILEVLPSPLAELSVNNNSGCEDLAVQLTNQSIFNETFSWDLGDGSFSTDPSFTYTYTAAGTYTVILTANHSNGCPSDTAQIAVEVFPKPIANFTFDQPFVCGAPQEIQFTNISTGSQDNDWSFGGLGVSNQTSPSFTFTEIGSYPIQLLVSNEYDCRDTSIQVIDIYGAPLANFNIEIPVGCEDMEVVIENLSSEALTYVWQVEGQPNSDAVNPEYLFTEPGNYDVQLIASYNEFCQDTLFLPGAIQVYQSPVADFSYVADESENIIGDVRFTNRSLLSDRYFWNLGDGTTTVATDPVHEYDINRSIEVLLIAYNDNNGLYTCVDSLILPVDPEWITTYWVPSGFSPEYGEGDVRLFRPQGIGINEYEITVYSPWGEQVWYSTALQDNRPTGAWDGMHNGVYAPQGAYVYLARVFFVDGTARVYKGTVTLLR